MMRNGFEEKLTEASGWPLKALEIDTLQVNLGFLCNQNCSHCHLAASPHRTEVMAWETVEQIVGLCRRLRFGLADLTGGAPELNPYFRRFVSSLCETGTPVQVRTNLTVLLEPDMESLPGFLREYRVRLVASLPCYLQENVDHQRGRDVHRKSIEALRRLNGVGYGIDPGLPLDLVYNPAGAFLPPGQDSLEATYRRELLQRYGIRFSHLLTITNMPIGRFMDALRRENRDEEYLELLRTRFNPETVDGLMCRHQLSVGWDGTLYDCDFNLALRLPVNGGTPNHISRFDLAVLSKRRIVTGEHCFACTAGAGSSCRGALS